MGLSVPGSDRVRITNETPIQAHDSADLNESLKNGIRRYIFTRDWIEAL